MAGLYGMCTKCHEIKHLTKHHLIPRRIRKKQRKPPILFLCRDCHDLIETRLINVRGVKDSIRIAKDFIRR